LNDKIKLYENKVKIIKELEETIDSKNLEINRNKKLSDQFRNEKEKVRDDLTNKNKLYESALKI
jgi:hypothetical protein